MLAKLLTAMTLACRHEHGLVILGMTGATSSEMMDCLADCKAARLYVHWLVDRVITEAVNKQVPALNGGTA